MVEQPPDQHVQGHGFDPHNQERKIKNKIFKPKKKKLEMFILKDKPTQQTYHSESPDTF